MTRKIALEEHFLVEGFANMGRTEGSGPAAAFRRQVALRLPEIDALRLAAMDKADIDMAVLSLFQPGIQGERGTATAVRKAKAVNDTLAERIARHPARFRGFAAVPMQDPPEAAAELKHAVTELGFKGALINGHTLGVYLDDARILPFWERAAALDVPIYLHPANPVMVPAAFEAIPAWRRRCSTGRRRPAATRCASSLGALRPLPVARGNPRPYGRGAPLLPLADRQPLQAQRAQGGAPASAVRIQPPQHRRHHRRRLRTRPAALRGRRNGPRPRAILGRLPASRTATRPPASSRRRP